MKYLLHTLIGLFILASCKTSKNYLSRADEDKTLFDVVKALEKKADDEKALAALPIVYDNARQRHLKKIDEYTKHLELNRWDKIIGEYDILQKMYYAITSVDAANNLVAATDYQQPFDEIREQAAKEYYSQASQLLNTDSRNNAKQAFNYFKKIDGWIPDYKNAKAKMDEAYQNAIVNIVINPVIDNTYFSNTGRGNRSNQYGSEYFQQKLVRELGGENSRYPARFYTQWEARQSNIYTNWVVDLTLRTMDIPRPSVSNYTRNLSKKIETGKDSSSKPIYQTVYATLNVTRRSFTARAEMELRITETGTRKNIANNTYREDYDWKEEHATYTGDSRALNGSDWKLVNNNKYNEPSKEEVLNKLYEEIYDEVKRKIANTADW